MPLHLLIPRLSVLAAAVALARAASAADGALPDGLYAEIGTPKGTITCRLDDLRAPLTVASFVGLAEGTLGPRKGKPFFDGLTFHRVVPGFVIQGGDPLGTGEGGPGYTFPDEVMRGLSHDSAGVLSMANDGPDTNGSQFFITLGPAERLDYLYAVFGRVVGGAGVPARIAQGDRMTVRILRIGAGARAFRADEQAFAALLAKAPRYGGEREPGPKAHFDDPDKLLPDDPPRAVSFNYKLNNFERATRRRVYARVFKAIPAAGAGGSPQAYADQLASQLGLASEGILAVYIADSKTWTLSVGSSLRPRFAAAVTGSADATPGEVTRHFLDAAAERRSRYEAEVRRVLANNLPTPATTLKTYTDAVLDELLLKAPL